MALPKFCCFKEQSSSNMFRSWDQMPGGKIFWIYMLMSSSWNALATLKGESTQMLASGSDSFWKPEPIASGRGTQGAARTITDH